MQYLTLVIMLSVTLGQYLSNTHLAPPLLKYLPEGLSVLCGAIVLLAGPRDRFRFVAPRYWLAFFATAAVVGCGVLANHVAPGPLLEGLRFYLRAMPMFFLPAVFAVSESQLRTQLRLLLAIALVQVPLSMYQRYTIYARGHMSGDDVYGTLIISSILTIFLIGVICVAAALALRGRLSKAAFFCLFVLLVIPTTINETKSTVFLLPIGLLTTLLVGTPPRKRARVGMSAVLLLTVFGALFVPIYDFFAVANNPYPYTLESFFSDKKRVMTYLDKNTDVGSRGEVGRVDAIVAPIQEFSSDPVHLMFGVGIYNASYSGLGNNFTGEYYPLLGRYAGETSGATFLVETGMLGLALVLLLYWLVFRDAVFVARHDTSIIGALALGWLGIMVVMVIATFYKTLHAFESLSYLFWYFAGVIAAQRMRLELGELGHASLSDSGRPPGLDDIPRRVVHDQEPRPLKLSR
jgi:hypothetical protein